MQDLRFAIRSLRNNRGFALAALAALALGIGAASAIFSLVNGVLLRPLPFPRSDRLVNVWETSARRNNPRSVVAPGNYYDWRSDHSLFLALGAFEQSNFTLDAGGNEPERIPGATCDRGFFEALQVYPAMGRIFTGEEDRQGQDNVVILSHAAWMQRFGGDERILGRALILDGRSRTVIGVMPEGFDYPVKAAMWTPLAFADDMRARRDFHRLRVIARLKDSLTLEAARAQLQTVGARMAAQYPAFNRDESIAANKMLDDTVGQVRPALMLLLGAVGFVLAIACANVANLLLARAAAQQREMAVRTSLGASRLRLVRQLLTESLLLAVLGGAAGLALADAALKALIALAPANLPRLDQAALDWRAVAFTAAVSVGSGILFGLVPAWRTASTGSRTSTVRRSWFTDALVVAQVAAALILLAGAGLLMRSLRELLHLDAGWDPARVMTMRLSPAPIKFKGHPDRQADLARAILHRAVAVPGVELAAIGTQIPLQDSSAYIMRFEGRPAVLPSEAPIADTAAITPDYFRVLGIRLKRGRAFTDRDTAGSPLTAIVNQTLANRYFPGQDPIGKRLEIAFRTPPAWREIVGVAADVRSTGLDREPPVQVYLPYLQTPTVVSILTPAVTLLAKVSEDHATLGPALKQAILEADRSQPVYAIQPMTEILSQSIAQRKLLLILLAFFAASALFLAALGLYGVMSYAVTRRTRELGIRMALGARQAEILRLVQRQGMQLVLVGLAAGAAGALLLSRLIASLLFHVQPYDALTFGSVALLLATVGLVACTVPARKAARVDPALALRHE